MSSLGRASLGLLALSLLAACSDGAGSDAPTSDADPETTESGSDGAFESASTDAIADDATADDVVPPSDTGVAGDTSATADASDANDANAVDASGDVGVATGDCDTPPKLAGKDWYATISTAKVYQSGAAGALRGCWLEYRPAYELWSDGLVKRRFIYLPKGTTIATGPNPTSGAAPNMDRWVFPVGTRFLKEFARASDGKKLETRIWERTAAGYNFGAFRWRADQSDADYTESGGAAALPLDDGTAHDIPRRNECTKCHDGEPGEGLGFSAVQLSKAAGASDPTLSSIIAKGWLSHPPSALPSAVGSPVPGTSTEAAALGALHANCGHCHNPMGQANAVGMELRVRYGETTAASTHLYATTVGVPTTGWSKAGITLRIDPGSASFGDGAPGKSAVWYRNSVRGGADQMPPLGTALVDTSGSLKAIDTWIRGL
jgi:hypothetical protein